jgi:hypothetical protein
VRVLRAELPKFEAGRAERLVAPCHSTVSVESTPPAPRRDFASDRTSLKTTTTQETAHPGEQAFAATSSPLAARLNARRVPGVSSTPLTTRFTAPGAGVHPCDRR